MLLNLILFCPPLGSFQFVYIFPEVWRRMGQSTSVRLCLYWDKSSGKMADLVVLAMLLLVHLRKTLAVFGAHCLLSLSPESVTVFASYCTFCVCAFFLPSYIHFAVCIEFHPIDFKPFLHLIRVITDSKIFIQSAFNQLAVAHRFCSWLLYSIMQVFSEMIEQNQASARPLLKCPPNVITNRW